MSYRDHIQAERRHEFEELRDACDYIEHFIQRFQLDNPFENIADVELTISNRIILIDTFFDGIFPMNIRFINCYFLGEVKFHDCTFEKKISIEHCFCDEEFFFFKTAKFKDEFNLINLVVRRQLYVEGGEYAKCLWNLMENATITIAGGFFEELNIGYWDGAILRELTLDNRKTSGFIKISGERTKIEYLLIFESSKDLIISIEDISLNILSIYRYRNDAGFRLTNIRPLMMENPSEISIAESYLGKAEFYSINFRQFTILSILNTHLTDVSFVNIGWKYDIKALKGSRVSRSAEEEALVPKLEALEKDWYAQADDGKDIRKDPVVKQYFTYQRETYRQLKFALGKQGDVINEQRFHTHEMIAYDKTLKLTKDLWTVIIIKFSFWFSDFGQSFIRPLRALLLGQLIFLFFYIYAGGVKGVVLSIEGFNLLGFKLALGKYFYLINPLRKIDDGLPANLMLIDLSMRIWASYMLYNIIRATRRFIK